MSRSELKVVLRTYGQAAPCLCHCIAQVDDIELLQHDGTSFNEFSLENEGRKLGTSRGFSFAKEGHAPAEEAIVVPGFSFDLRNPYVLPRRSFRPKAGRGRLRIARTVHPRYSTPSHKHGCRKPLELFCEFQVGKAPPQIPLRRVVACRTANFGEGRVGVEEVESASPNLESAPRRAFSGHDS